MGPPSGALDAGLAASLLAVGLLWLGFGLTGLVPAWRQDLVARFALAFPAVVFLALAMMLVHVGTGGALFRSPLAVRACVASLAVLLALRWLVSRRAASPRAPSPGRRDLGLAIACSLLVVLVWGSPVFRLLPLASGGDITFHAGWTEQLLNGQPLPTAPVTGDVPNYYPWLYHALLALATHLTPGGHAYLGLTPLHLLQALGAGAALFGLGHALAGRWAGAATAVLGAVAGGWGFRFVGGLVLVTDPRVNGGEDATRYAGDLLFTRSYNVSFANLAPSYPRDVALVLLIAALFLLARAARAGRTWELVAAGVLLGLVGLTQTDAFFVGILAAAFVTLLVARGRRLRTGAAVLVPALALFSLWALPVAVSYVRLGGFVDTTVVQPVVLPAWAILGAWGIVTPLAAVGAVRAGRSFSDPAVRVVVAVLAASGLAVLASSLLPAILDEGFETIGRAHRYWPLLSLSLAILGGLGIHWIGSALSEHSRAAAAASAICVVALALPSPLVASLALPAEKPPPPDLQRALRGDRRHPLNALARYGDGVCAASAPEPARAFSYTGYRFLRFGDPLVRENSARIRWAEIYEHIVPEEERVRDEASLEHRSSTPTDVRGITHRYDLDVVVLPAWAADREAFRGVPRRWANDGERRYVVYGLGRC